MTGWRRNTLLAAACWIGQPVLAQAQVPQALQSAEALATSIDAAERSPALAAGLDDVLDLPTVAAEVAKVRDYLSTNPDDVFALILSVRLGRVHDLLAFREAVGRAFSEPGADLPEPPSSAGYLQILDGILARDSSVAAAHYWTARVLVEEALRAAEMGAEGAAPDTAQTAADHRRILRHAEAAVALAPGNVQYREFFALLLVGTGQADAAVAVLSHPSTAGTLLHLLVQDLQTFGPPPEAEPDAVLGNFVAMTGMMGAADSEEPTLALYLDVRLNAWSTSAPLAEVEAYYRARWPDMRFFAGEGWEGAVTAAFVPTPEGWRAVSDSVEFHNGTHDTGDVMLILLPPDVVAQMGDAAVMQGAPSEIVPSGPRVGILYMNWRLGSGGDESVPSTMPPPRRDESGPHSPAAESSVPPRPTILPLEGPLYPIARHNSWGLIDSLGRVVLEPAFEEIGGAGAFSGNDAVAYIRLTDGVSPAYRPIANLPVWTVWSGRPMLLTQDGTYVPMDGLEPQGQFDEGLLAVKRSGKIGFIDERGDLKIAPQFDQVGPFRDGRAFVQVDGRWGVIDSDVNVVVEPTWDDVNLGRGWGDSEWVSVRVGDRWGVVDRAGTVLIEPRFELSSHGGVPYVAPPFVTAREGRRAFYARIDGSVAFEVTCPGNRDDPDLWWFRGALAEVRCGERPGIVDTTGRWVVEPTREGVIDIVNDTLLCVSWGTPRYDGLQRFSYVTTSGRVIAESTGSRFLQGFHDGLIRFLDKSESKFGRIGYMDPSGTIVIPPRFDVIGTFVGGLAPAGIEGRFGFIDWSGEWVIPPEWDRAEEFAGPLALVTRQSRDCKSMETAYINRSGRVVYSMVFDKPSVFVSSRCM